MLNWILFVALGWVGISGQPVADRISWMSDYSSARKIAYRENKLLLVYLYEKDSPMNKPMEKTLEDSRVVQVARNFVPVKLQAETAAWFIEKYEIDGFPTALLVAPTGEQMGMLPGIYTPTLFADEMEKMKTGFDRFPTAAKKLKTSPNDGKANADMSVSFAVRGRLDEALKYLRTAEKSGYKGPELAEAYNFIGDIYQFRRTFDTAISYFKKADVGFASNKSRSYSKLSIMYCCFSKGDYRTARKFAEAVLAFKGSSEEYKQHARRMLESIKRIQGGSVEVPGSPLPPPEINIEGHAQSGAVRVRVKSSGD